MKKLSFIIVLFIAASANGQWAAIGNGVGYDYQTSVYALTVYNNNLIAGFMYLGSPAPPSILEVWDGSIWDSISGFDCRVDDNVDAFTIYGGNLIVGGSFTIGTATGMNNIAEWNGTTWSALNYGIYDQALGTVGVNSLIVYDSTLIAGGGFLSNGVNTLKYIAYWNDSSSSWNLVGTGVNGVVRALAIYNNNLILGGSFDSAGGNRANYIAEWNGVSFSPLGSGLNNLVYALNVYNGNLIAGGSFTLAGGITANCIAKWNGLSWDSVGNNNQSINLVSALDTLNGSLYMAESNGSYPDVLQWNNFNWSDLWFTDFTLSGQSVNAMTAYNNNLIVGGMFTYITSGGISANYVAQYDITPCIGMTITRDSVSASMGCNGEAGVTVSGGNSPYTYSWSPGGGTNDTINGKCAGDYCCTIIENNGCSQTACITIKSHTGIENINNSSDINIYPEPNNGNFTVTGVKQGQVLELYNYICQKVSSSIAGNSTMHFDISDRVNGIYLIRILNKDGTLVTQKKIVKTQ
jgi:Secretion system C-terminal sorting domain